jgi:hypothetical protein
VVRTYRGRHESKVTEEEEDEEYLKEEDALASAGGTRLLIQPSCERLLDDSIKSFISFTSLYVGDVRIIVCCTAEGLVILRQNATKRFSCSILTAHAKLTSICYTFLFSYFLCL